MPPQPHRVHHYAYRLSARLDGFPQSTALVCNTFVRDDPADPERQRRTFIVDFADGDLAFWLKDAARVEAIVTNTGGSIVAHKILPHHRIGGFRVVLEVAAAPGETCDLRLYLRAGAQALSETWINTWSA